MPFHCYDRERCGHARSNGDRLWWIRCLPGKPGREPTGNETSNRRWFRPMCSLSTAKQLWRLSRNYHLPQRLIQSSSQTWPSRSKRLFNMNQKRSQLSLTPTPRTYHSKKRRQPTYHLPIRAWERNMETNGLIFIPVLREELTPK